MKRNILIIGILSILMLSTDALMAQRGRQGQRNDRGDYRKETRDKPNRGKSRYDRGRSGSDRGKSGYNRGQNGNRKVKVVNRSYVSYDGYRGGSYYRYGSSRDFQRYQRYGKPYRPSLRHIWVAGHWKYSRRLDREVWIDGSWQARQNHHRWVQGHYSRRGGIRIWIPGCWVVF